MTALSFVPLEHGLVMAYQPDGERAGYLFASRVAWNRGERTVWAAILYAGDRRQDIIFQGTADNKDAAAHVLVAGYAKQYGGDQ